MRYTSTPKEIKMIAKTLGALDGVVGLAAGALKKVIIVVFLTALLASAVTAAFVTLGYAVLS